MAKRRYTNNLINEMYKMLNQDIINETMSWQDGPSYNPEANEPGFDGGPDLGMDRYPDEEMGYPQQQEAADPEVTQIINQIRQMALQGITKLANNPTSMQYDALKKIWQIVDKTVEVKEPKKI